MSPNRKLLALHALNPPGEGAWTSENIVLGTFCVDRHAGGLYTLEMTL